MAYQGDDNDDFGQNEEQQSASNDYQSIFNPDAEDTEQDYQQYMAKLNMDTPQGGGGGDNSSKKKKSYKKREPPSNSYNEYSDHNNQNDQNDSNNNNNNNTFDDNNYNDNNDNNDYPDYDNDNVENNDEYNDIYNDTNNNNNFNNNNNNNKKHNKAKPATIKYKWQWDGGSYWKDYKFEDSQTIETQYGSKDFMFLQIYGTSYQINFANLQQVNTKTGGKRRLRRVPLNHKDNSKQASGSSRGRGRGRGSGSGRGSGRGGGGRGGYSSYKGGHTGYNNNATGGGGGYNNNNYGNNDRGGYGGNASNNRGRGRGSGSGRGGGMGRGGYHHNKSNNNNNNYGGNYNANNSNYNNNNNNNNHNNNVAPATWQIFLGGSWKDYDSGTCSYIESKFQQKNQMIFECTIRGNKYFINLNDMTQANAYTGKTRQIKRKGNTGSSVGGNGGNYQQQNQKQKQNQNKNQHYNNNAQNNYNNDNDKNRSIFDKGDMKQQYQDNNNDYNNSNSYNNNNNNNNNQFGNNQQQPMNNQRGPGPDNNNNTSFQQNQRPQQQQNQGNFNNNNSNYNPNKGLKDNNSNNNMNYSMDQNNDQNRTNQQNNYGGYDNNNMNNMGYDGNSGYNPNQNKQYNNNDDDNKNNYNTFNNNNNNQNNQQLKGSPHKWQWQDGNGNFLDYDSTTSSQMEQLYQNGSKIYKYKAPHNKQIYTIKFNDLKQYNDQTKQSRDIRRVPMSVPSGGASSGVKMNVNNNSGPTMKWQWHDGKNFIDYDKTKSIAMQKAYKSGQKSFSFKHDKSQTKYVINFNRMKQINLKSQNERDIRQVPLSVKGAKPQKPKPKQQKQTTAEGWPNPDTWKGPKATAKRKVFGDKIMTLYHVTDPKSADLIWKDRKMIRGSKGMFGGGIYFAESAASAQYKAEHHGYLLTCKVFVGKEHVVKDSAAGHFTFQDMQKMGCDSVWAPNGSGSGKSERVVYNFDQVCVFKKTKFAPKGKK